MNRSGAFIAPAVPTCRDNQLEESLPSVRWTLLSRYIGTDGAMKAPLLYAPSLKARLTPQGAETAPLLGGNVELHRGDYAGLGGFVQRGFCGGYSEEVLCLEFLAPAFDFGVVEDLSDDAAEQSFEAR